MIRCLLAVCADSVSVDQFTNTLSITSVLEQITSPSFPAVLPKITCVFLLERDPDDSATHECELRVVLPGVAEPFKARAPIDFRSDHRTRLVAVLQAVQLVAPGEVVVSAWLHESELGSWRIPVTVGAAKPQVVSEAPSQ
jgi:hypothetical protein